MADKEYDDEYQMDDLDTMEAESLGEKSDSELPTYQSSQAKPNVRRNALIVVGLIALSLLGYKFIGSFFTPKQKTTQEIPSVPLSTVATPPVVSTPVQQPEPVTQLAPQVTTPAVDTTEINQKLSSVEASQQDVRLEVNSVNSKLSGINNNVSDLTDKIANLNQMIASLAAKLDQQSSEITLLTERTKPKPLKYRITKSRPRMVYRIQAIIPGRAWLIASNGSTITVREGTRIANYGLVKLIDPIQGRVLMNSGRVIRFSQQDS
ncbi:MAG: type IV secretion protein IcmG [Tatlockia sp.]|nr:type IV secretion protein IcmG [Tatlockia sp.]